MNYRHHHGNGIGGYILGGIGLFFGVIFPALRGLGLICLLGITVWAWSEKAGPIFRSLVRLIVIVAFLAGLILLIAD